MRSYLLLPTVAWATVFGLYSAIAFAVYVLFLKWVFQGNFSQVIDRYSPY